MLDDDGIKQLAIEEYKSLRSLIEKNIDIMEKNEVYALGAAGALFVFSISATSRPVALAAAWTPLLIAFVGWLRFLGLDKAIDITNDYFLYKEIQYGEIEWVSWYKRQNIETGKILKRSRILFWIVFKIACIGFGGFMTAKAPLATAKPGPGMQDARPSNPPDATKADRNSN